MPTARLLILLLLLPGVARAGGLFTPDSGLVCLGRAGACAASAGDVVGAIVHNPALLADLDGLRVEGGAVALRNARWFERAGGEGGEESGTWNARDGVRIEGSLDEGYPRLVSQPVFRPIPEAGVAFGVPGLDLTFALALHAPMAPIQRFDPWGSGRYRTVEQVLVQGNVSLSVGYRPLPWLAIGGGFQLLILQFDTTLVASADLLAARRGDEHNSEDPQWDASVRFQASQVRPHWHAGVLIQPRPWLRVGLSFSPPYALSGQGKAELTGRLGSEFFSDSLVASLYGDHPIEAVGHDERLTIEQGMPALLKGGIAFEPIPGRLLLELDGVGEFWPRGDLRTEDVDLELFVVEDGQEVPLEQALDERGLCDFLDPDDGCEGLGTYRGPEGDGVVLEPTNFRPVGSVRFGAEVTPHPWIALRAGYGFESSGIPADSLGLTMLDAPKHLISGGADIRFGAVGLRGAENSQEAPVALRVTVAHVAYHRRTVIGRGAMIALQGVPTNVIDSGTYGGHSWFFGANVALNLSEVGRRVR